MIFLFHPCFAQNEKKLSIPRRFISSFEALLGLGNSKFRGSDGLTNQVLNPVFSYGAGLSHTLSDRFDLNVKFLVERKGFKADELSTYPDPFNNNTPTTVREIRGDKLDYITISVFSRYFFDVKKHFYMGVGGFAGYLTKATNYTETYSLQGNLISYNSGDQLSQFKKYDVGLSFNLGYMTPLSKRLGLNFQLVNTIGLTDIINHDQPNVNPTDELKNNSISLLVGVSLKK
jgi:hypothetical protein